MPTKRALVCDDDRAIRRLVQALVRREGYEVDEADDGRAGIQKMETGCYEIVILDLMMPDVDGRAVVEFLRNRRPADLKHVIVMTAASETLDSDFPVPICAVLPKPFDIVQFTAAVRHCSGDCDGAVSRFGA